MASTSEIERPLPVLRFQVRRRLLARGLTLVAMLLLVASAYQFRPSPLGTELPLAFGLMLAGGFALGGAVRLHRQSWRETLETPRLRVAARTVVSSQLSGWRGVLPYFSMTLGLLLLLLLVEINGGFFGLGALGPVPLRIQFGLLCLALPLLTWGLGGGLVAVRPVHRRSLLSASLLMLIAITLLALVLRVWALETSVHKFVDEIHFSTAVSGINPAITAGKLLAPFAGITAFPWLYPYWQAEIASLNGRNLESLRLVSAILGALTVPALYLLARTLFDRTTAIMAALLLATFPPHLHFSRIGLNNVADPLFGTLALAFLARGLKSGRRMDYAIAGTALGLTQYFYEGGRLLFPPLVLVWIVVLWLFQHLRSRTTPANYRLDQRGLLTLALSALLVGLPIYTTLLALHLPVVPRMETVALGGSYWQRVVQEGLPQTAEQQFFRPLLVYVHLPELGLFYGGDQPMIVPSLVPVFLLGVFGLVWRGRQPGIVVLLWVLLTSAGNMLMTESAVYARYVVAFPALALLLALGIRYTLPLFGRGKFWPIIMIPLAAFLASLQVQYYFGQHLEVYNRQLRSTYDAEDAMFRAANFPPGTRIHVVSEASTQYLMGVLGYVTANLSLTVNVISPADFSELYFSTLEPTVPHAFFIQPDDQIALHLLQAHFELGEPQFSPYAVPKDRQLALYFVPGKAAEVMPEVEYDPGTIKE